MLRFALGLCALSLLACNACNGGGTAPPPPVPAASGPAVDAPTGETVLHTEDDGRTFDVTRGSAVTFKLASNAGTGFVWTAAPVDQNVLTQQGDRTSEPSSEAPGAPKMDVYRFVAKSAGSTVVEMDLKRPWGNQPPGRVVRVTINVH